MFVRDSCSKQLDSDRPAADVPEPRRFSSPLEYLHSTLTLPFALMIHAVQPLGATCPPRSRIYDQSVGGVRTELLENDDCEGGRKDKFARCPSSAGDAEDEVKRQRLSVLNSVVR